MACVSSLFRAAHIFAFFKGRAVDAKINYRAPVFYMFACVKLVSGCGFLATVKSSSEGSQCACTRENVHNYTQSIHSTHAYII